MAYVTIPRKDLQLVDQIGVGGFSVVYKALWNSKEVAAKRLNMPDRHEVEILSRLNHPNIVNLIGVVDEKFDFFLILELCEGGSLRSYLNAHKGKRPVQFYDWAKQAARPIEYLKKMQFVHKDVKSPNYLITNGNILKLADFGLAKNIDITISRATGTASYAWMAPELLREEKLSPTYDIYSFGIVVWEIWTTDIPFEDAVVPQNLMWRICNNDERPPIPLDCPKPIADLMRQCWEIDWSKRPSIEHILLVLTTAESAEKEEQLPYPLVLERELGQNEPGRMLTTAASAEIGVRQWIPGTWVLERELGQNERGMLVDANSIAVSPNGNIAVADYSTACVPVYSNEGGYIFSLDTMRGMEPGSFSNPWNVTVNADGIYYVTDTMQYVKVYDAMGVYKSRWTVVSPDNKLSATANDKKLCGLAIDANGHLLVGQVRPPVKYISKHMQDGSHITSIKVGIRPCYLAATSQDTIIICDWVVNDVQIVDNTGQVLHILNQSRHLSLWKPWGVCCYDNIIFIANSDNKKTHEVTCFSISGEYMGSIAIEKWPRDIAFVKEGYKIIVPCMGQVQIYSPKM